MPDWQLIAVVTLVAVAAVYTLRSFLRQFHRSDDDAESCSGCSARDRIEGDR